MRSAHNRFAAGFFLTAAAQAGARISPARARRGRGGLWFFTPSGLGFAQGRATMRPSGETARIRCRVRRPLSIYRNIRKRRIYEK